MDKSKLTIFMVSEVLKFSKISLSSRYFLFSLLFGGIIGIVFPFFSLIFIESFKSTLMFYFYQLACLVAGLLVGVITYKAGRLMFYMVFQNIQSELERLATGDLDSELDINSNDVVGTLAIKYNELIARFTGIVYSVVGTADYIANFLDRLYKIMEKYSELTTSQSTNVNSLNKFMKILLDETSTIQDGTQKEFDIVISLVNRIQDLSDTIDVTSSSTHQALDYIVQTNQLKKRSEDAIKTMQTSMNSISSRSGEVTGIIRIIQDISEQINLLSLNAAIESARAGDSGRGFAVVADEISKLADMTSASVKDVERLISENEREITAGIENFNITINSIDEIMNQITAIDTIMQDIHESMEIQQKQNYEVSKESDVVQKVAKDIKDTIQEHNLTVSYAGKQLEQIYSSVQEISERAEFIRRNVNELKVQSGQLIKAISFFKIDF
jgi:methyl-accepting chemotaxis protein